MRILYAVQATGNGHIARALEIGPALARTAEVDYMISGSQDDLQLPKQAAMSYHGASFVFGRSGGIDLVATLRAASTSQADYVTVYLPAYHLSSMKEVFSEIKDVRWRIFVKGLTPTAHSGHMSFFAVGHPVWLESLANAYAVILGSGFESPSEALFLGKRLLTIPMHNQYEQLCNAAALAKMGVTTARHLSVELIPEIRRWLQDGAIIQMDYPDHTDEIVHRALAIADTILT